MISKKLKAAWIKALRSRGYRQTTAALQSGPRNYCCLGVLCRVAERTTDFKPRINDGVLLGGTLKMQGNNFGLTKKQQNVLIKMNDQKGESFTTIAEYIQKNVKAA